MVLHSVVKWPGCVHDSRVFAGSTLKNIYEGGNKHTHRNVFVKMLTSEYMEKNITRTIFYRQIRNANR